MATGPVSRPSSMRMTMTPVSASPAMMARATGAAPRQRGSSEACRLRQPSGGASRIGSAAGSARRRRRRRHRRRARRSVRPRRPPSGVAGVTTGMPKRSATSCTGDLRSAMPRPAARGGWRIDRDDLMALTDDLGQRRDGESRGAEEDDAERHGAGHSLPPIRAGKPAAAGAQERRRSNSATPSDSSGRDRACRCSGTCTSRR